MVYVVFEKGRSFKLEHYAGSMCIVVYEKPLK